MTNLQKENTKVQEFVILEQKLQLSFDNGYKSKNKLEYKVYVLKENLVETFIVYFDQAKEQMTFFYTRMHLSLMDMLQVICDGQQVDNTNYPSLFELVTSFVKDWAWGK